MHKKIAAVVLAAGVLLGLSGCTPAAGNGEDTASPDTTTSITDQAAVEESVQPDESGETETADSAVAPNENVDGGETQGIATETESDTSVSAVSESNTSSAPNDNLPINEEGRRIDGWGVIRDVWEDGLDLSEFDPAYIPSFSEGGTPEDFITTTYDAADLAGNFESLCMIYPGQNVVVSADLVNAYYPFECVRKMDEDRFYVVYKVRQGGYYYMIFQKIQGVFNHEEPAFMLTNVSYVGNKRSYADYEQAIIPGTPISEAENVDYAWELYKDWQSDLDKEVVVGRAILTDGMLFILYERNDAGDYLVSEAKYYPDFIEDFGDIAHNYSILESDYPA